MQASNEIHVVPRDDLKEHTIAITCWCNPAQDEIGINLWVHNSADGREHTLEKGKKQ